MCNKHNKDIVTNTLSICKKVTKNVYVHVLNTENFLKIQTYLILIFFDQFLSGHKEKKKKSKEAATLT